jgi:TolB protein
MNTKYKSNIAAGLHRQVLSAVCLSAFLFVTAAFAQTPTLRANGKIAFTSDRDGNQEIYVMNNDGTSQVRITNNLVADDHPTWSRDGTKIAFVSQRSAGGFALSVMNADGTNKVEITPLNYVDSFLWLMSWSPDSSRITFQDNNDIFVVNADGSNRQILVNNPAFDGEPAWSPDGSKILFVSNRINQFYGNLYTIKPDGTDLRALASDNDYSQRSPDWSPTGNKITFWVYDYANYYTISTANADGTDLRDFGGCSNGSPVSEDCYKPKWSPDGSKIIFHKVDYASGFDAEIYEKNVDGGGYAQLTNTTGKNFNPSWQPLTNGKSRRRIRFF